MPIYHQHLIQYPNIMFYYQNGNKVLLDQATVYVDSETNYVKTVGFNVMDIVFNDRTHIQELKPYSPDPINTISHILAQGGLEKVKYEIQDEDGFTITLELQVPFFADEEHPHLNLLENIHAVKLGIMTDFSSWTKHTDIAMNHHLMDPKFVK